MARTAAKARALSCIARALRLFQSAFYATVERPNREHGAFLMAPCTTQPPGMFVRPCFPKQIEESEVPVSRQIEVRGKIANEFGQVVRQRIIRLRCH